MQSFLQYRRIGRRVEQSHRRYRERSRTIGTTPDAASAYDSPVEAKEEVETPDVEMADTVDFDFEPGADESSFMPIGVRVMTRDEVLELDRQATPGEPSNRRSKSTTRTPEASQSDALSRSSTTRGDGGALGQAITGVDVRKRTTHDGNKGEMVHVVGFHGDNDPENPHNWSFTKRLLCTFMIASIGFIVGFASSIDSSALASAAAEFGVSEVAESLATGLYLIGFGCGAPFAGPISEEVGRNPVYIVAVALYMIFVMASGLAPNFGAQLAFRFLAGFFGSTPLVCAGGSIADMWNPMERTLVFPIFANAAFSGPIFGPVIGGWIVQSKVLNNWRWTEWITLIMSGLVLILILFFQPETFSNTILRWRAKQLRRVTGDERYRAQVEIRGDGFIARLKTALIRPLFMTIYEPTVALVTLYLTVIYIILFTFLDGYTFIFADVYGLSDGLTGLCFLGIEVGLLCGFLLTPIIYKWTKREMAQMQERGETKLRPEVRLWSTMLGGSIGIPISLFWMGWTDYSSISIWSPLIASALFGYGVITMFISCYMYIIDVYEIYAASALVSATLIRYTAAGGMTVVGIPFYENLGVHWTLTILACISALCAPIPYLFYVYGKRIRAKSRYARI